MSGGTAAAEVAALQRALAAEHAVIWGYGVVGARVGLQLRDTVRGADDHHRARRDGTAALVRDRGARPAAAAPSYDLPEPVTDQPSALRLAVRLEEGTAAAWRAVLGATSDAALRRTALSALSDAAVRATTWRAGTGGAGPLTVPFPGT